MVRAVLSGMSLAVYLTIGGAALAQTPPSLPRMPPPPSFGDPVPTDAKARKATRKPAKAAGRASTSGSQPSFERPNKFVPAEFDHERGGGSRGGATPMMTGSGRPGMGMKF